MNHPHDITSQELRTAHAALDAAVKERDNWKRQHDAVLSQARKDNLRAEDADRYEQWLLDLGRISGCGHVDDRLPRCIEEAFEQLRQQLAEATADCERLRGNVNKLRSERDAALAGETSLFQQLADAQRQMGAKDEALRRTTYALGAFVGYYDQSGIGECLEGRDDEGGSFDGDERFNVRLGRNAIEQGKAALTPSPAPAQPDYRQPFYVVPMPLDKDGNGPCEGQPVRTVYEVWSDGCVTVSCHDTYDEAEEAKRRYQRIAEGADYRQQCEALRRAVTERPEPSYQSVIEMARRAAQHREHHMHEWAMAVLPALEAAISQAGESASDGWLSPDEARSLRESERKAHESADRVQEIALRGLEKKRQQIVALQKLVTAGQRAFITCESGGANGYACVAKFHTLDEAQAFHQAMVDCGQAAISPSVSQPTAAGEGGEKKGARER